MKWKDYLQKVLIDEKSLDEIILSFDGINTRIPLIIKASVYLLEKMIQNQGKNNLFVFPDGKQLPFLFMLSKLIYNIQLGKIGKAYDPEKFIPGQKLKLGKAIVEFVKIEQDKNLNNKKSIYVRTGGGPVHICPLSYAPFFQTVDTNKKLSSDKIYAAEKKRMDQLRKENANYLETLIDMKTHMSDSIFYVASISGSRGNAEQIRIDNKSLFDYFLIGQTDYSGKIQTIKGKYTGVPALAFASQIAYVNEAILGGAKAQSVIINLIENDIENQMDSLDELMRFDIPILCVTDTVNSFELSGLVKRGFNIWRWDADSITQDLCNYTCTYADKKVESCLNSEVLFHEISAPKISEAFSLLYKFRRFIENESAGINKVYNILFDLAYGALRRIVLPSMDEKHETFALLDGCEHILNKEKPFLRGDVYDDFSSSILILKQIYEYNDFPKIQSLHDYLRQNKYDKFFLICANKDDPNHIKREWEDKLSKEGYRPTIKVKTVKEYLKEGRTGIDVVFVVGWYSANSVRKILYTYNVTTIHVLLYECEKKWKLVHEKEWKSKINSENNREIVNKSFEKSNNTTIEISVLKSPKITEADKMALVEQDNLEIIMQENKYRQYISRNGSSTDVVGAKPVSYVGGDFSLFTAGHKLIVVTKIIYQISNKIEVKEVDDVSVGDFVVIREYSRDLIKDVADRILSYNKKSELRRIASIWREALKIENAFKSFEDIYERLKEVGCERNIQTVKNWLYSEDIIIPQSKEDLMFIAKVTEDEVLREKLDEVYEAGQQIKKAHIMAGKNLSDRLTRSIATKIMEEKVVDPYNVWDPIELELEDVGPVKIFKIIDMGQEWIQVNVNDTNKILREDKEDVLWLE